MLISKIINYQAKQIVYSNSIQVILGYILLNKSSVSRTLGDMNRLISELTYSVVVLVVVVYCVHHCVI